MTQLNPQNFFAQTASGGTGAPSAKLKDLNDFVYGEIVDQSMVPATEFATGKQKVDSRTGEPIEQLLVVLQTEYRNWQGVARIPLVDKDNPNSGPKPPTEDDGRRAVYIEPWTNINAAVGEAVVAATGERAGLGNGGKLGIQVIELKDTGKGNPLKIHRAKYEPPVQTAAPADFFGGGAQPAPAQQAAPQGPPSVAAQQAVAERQAPPVQQAPVQDPWSGQPAPQPVSQNPYENQAAAQAQTVPPAQQAPAAAPTQDPWGAPAQGQPPF
jgi:hypothetical protein